jgi:hypothetical protein
MRKEEGHLRGAAEERRSDGAGAAHAAAAWKYGWSRHRLAARRWGTMSAMQQPVRTDNQQHAPLTRPAGS